MSFSCNGCGAELRGTGDAGYCSSYSEKMNEGYEEAEARWFSKSRLCHMCGNAWGPDPCDRCDAYNMPLYMVARKKKCKRFKEYVQQLLESYL